MVGKRNHGEGSVDPAHWDRILQEGGIPPQEIIETGIFGGVPGAEGAIVLPEDPHERAIVEKHLLYGEKNYSVNSPESFGHFKRLVSQIMREHAENVKKVTVHTSCIEDDSGRDFDSIIILLCDGTQIGFNTRNMEDYGRDNFIRWMQTRFGVSVCER